MASLEPYSWKCPYCGHSQVATDMNASDMSIGLRNSASKYGAAAIRFISASCLEKECRELSLRVEIGEADKFTGTQISKKLRAFRLMPSGRIAKVPACVPDPIKQDYSEACDIVSISPKAAATLARRALQGMIRDFAQISKDRLIDEVRELKTLVEQGKAPSDVSPLSVQAIDDVREIGNIGAHMEKDIGLIIDIEPEEATILLELVEQLFEDWYVARDARQKRFESLSKMSADKKAQKKGSDSPAKK